MINLDEFEKYCLKFEVYFIAPNKLKNLKVFVLPLFRKDSCLLQG